MPLPAVLKPGQQQASVNVADLTPLKVLRGQQDSNRFQDNASSAIKATSQHPVLDSRLVTVLTPASSSTPFVVQHGLGRIPANFSIAQSPVACSVSVIGGDANPRQQTTCKFSAESTQVVLHVW